MRLNIYSDGGARGNPGPAGYGFVVYDQNQQKIHQDYRYLGIRTNNEAEYLGLIAALSWLETRITALGVSQADIYLDSQLLVRQVNKLYKVKSVNLKPLYARLVRLKDNLKIPLFFYDIARSRNQVADRLANLAMDQSKR